MLTKRSTSASEDNWMHLRHPLANSFVSSYTAAVACLSFALALLLFCQQCHPPYVVGTDPLDVYFAASPLVVAQQGDKEPDAMPHNNGFSQEGAKAEAILISDCLLTGVLIGVGLIVGAAAAGITAVLNCTLSSQYDRVECLCGEHGS